MSLVDATLAPQVFHDNTENPMTLCEVEVFAGGAATAQSTAEYRFDGNAEDSTGTNHGTVTGGVTFGPVRPRPPIASSTDELSVRTVLPQKTLRATP